MLKFNRRNYYKILISTSYNRLFLLDNVKLWGRWNFNEELIKIDGELSEKESFNNAFWVHWLFFDLEERIRFELSCFLNLKFYPQIIPIFRFRINLIKKGDSVINLVLLSSIFFFEDQTHSKILIYYYFCHYYIHSWSFFFFYRVLSQSSAKIIF